MKKSIFLLALSLNFVLFSCKDKEEENEFSYQYADVEQSKSQLETNGQQMVAELQSFKDEKAIDAINSFGSLPLPEMPDVSFSDNQAVGVFAKLGTATINPQPDKIFNLLKSATQDTTTIQYAWEKLKGIYTWNSTSKDWVKTASTTKVEFRFPAQKGGTSNNAVFSISSYKGSAPVELGDYTGDLPVEIKANLTVDGTEYFAYSFAATYTSEGVPTLIETSAAFRTFVFAYKLVNNNSVISVNYSFKNGLKVIYDLGFEVNGNFATENLANAESPDQIIQSANAHFQLFNVKVAGIMDIAKIAAAERTVYEGEDTNPHFDYFKADSLFANEINKNAKLVVFFTDTKKKIADAEAYSYKHNESYWYWDYYTQSYKFETEVVSDISIRFKFADGSNVDQYFQTGFTTLKNDINDLVNDINTKFGSNIDPVE